jgi:homoserine acetyltransferase
LAEAVTNGYYEELQSDYGHDGFLLEFEKLAASINNFYSKSKLKKIYAAKS